MAKKLSYNEQLMRPEWQRKRLEIMNIHKFKCEICGSKTNTLHVHHRFYLKNRKAWEYDNDVLMCVCVDCHNKHHKKSETKQDVILKGKSDVYYKIIQMLDNNRVDLDSLEIILINIISNKTNIKLSNILEMVKKDVRSMELLFDNNFNVKKDTSKNYGTLSIKEQLNLAKKERMLKLEQDEKNNRNTGDF